MNRILYSNLHIKFNPLRNHVISSEAKKKVNINKLKQQTKIILRKFSSYTNRPPPPNNFWELVCVATAVWIINSSLKPPPSESSEFQKCI
jgi:hypothetical protein